MLALNRLTALLHQVALGCATLLLIVMSASSGQCVEPGRGLTVHVLRQSIEYGRQYLRRPASTLSRASTLEEGCNQDRDPSPDELVDLGFASVLSNGSEVHATSCLTSVRRSDAIGLRVSRTSNGVPLARAPPAPFV